MTIYINDQATELPEGITLADLLSMPTYQVGTRAAIALDEQIVRRESYAETLLSEGCHLLIINPTFGG